MKRAHIWIPGDELTRALFVGDKSPETVRMTTERQRATVERTH